MKHIISILLGLVLLVGCSIEPDLTQEPLVEDSDTTSIVEPIEDIDAGKLNTEKSTQDTSNENEKSVNENEPSKEEVPALVLPIIFSETKDELTQFGIKDISGKILIEPIYNYIHLIEHSYYYVASTDDASYIISGIDWSLSEPFTYDSYDLNLANLSQTGRYQVYQDPETKLYGYMFEGQKLTVASYDYATAFKDGYAIVGNGEYYDRIYKVINTDLQVIMEHDMRIISYGHGYFGLIQDFEVYDDAYNKVLLYNAKGDLVIDQQFFEVDVIDENLLLAADHIKSYLIDKTGTFLSESSNALATLPSYSEAYIINKHLYLYLDNASFTQSDLMIFNLDGELVYQSKDEQANSLTDLGDNYFVESHILESTRFTHVTVPQLVQNDDTDVYTSTNEKLLALYRDSIDQPQSIEEVYSTYEVTFDSFRTGHILDLNVYTYWYGFGAAHPNHFQETYHIDLMTGDMYKLHQMMTSEAAYTRLTDIIRAQANEEPERFFAIDEIIVDENTQYMLDQEGITLYYSPYEIAPYAAGYPSFHVSFESIANLIDQESTYFQNMIKD